MCWIPYLVVIGVFLRGSGEDRLLGWANGVLSTVLAVITPDIGPEVQKVKVQWLWVVVGDPDRLSSAHFGNEGTNSGAVRGCGGALYTCDTTLRWRHLRHWRVASTLTREQYTQSSTAAKTTSISTTITLTTEMLACVKLTIRLTLTICHVEQSSRIHNCKVHRSFSFISQFKVSFNKGLQ